MPKNKAVRDATQTASSKTHTLNDTSNSQVFKHSYNTPEYCPKFKTCNAPICPLDAQWEHRTQHNEDATCFYLIESVKYNAQAHFEEYLPYEFYEAIVIARSDMLVRHTRLKYVLEKAKLTGSRMIRKVGASHES